MKISACVIVKNEEKHLPKWLDCVKRLATELVVVDTGSSDATVAIAKAAGAKVFHFPWIDDFAAAKNYAIEQAPSLRVASPQLGDAVARQRDGVRDSPRPFGVERLPIQGLRAQARRLGAAPGLMQIGRAHV